MTKYIVPTLLVVSVLINAMLVFVIVNKLSQPINIDSDRLFTLVQNWRSENNLKQYETDPQLCGIAAVRAYEIQTDFNHNKFNARAESITKSTGYNYIGENFVRSGRKINPEQDGLNWWLHSPKHLQMLKDEEMRFSCISCRGAYCVQIFANY